MYKLFLVGMLQTMMLACASPQLSLLTWTWKHRLSILDRIDCMKEQTNGPSGV